MHLGKTPKTGRSLSFTLVWWNAKRKITRQQGETEGRGMDVGEWLGGWESVMGIVGGVHARGGLSSETLEM